MHHRVSRDERFAKYLKKQKKKEKNKTIHNISMFFGLILYLVLVLLSIIYDKWFYVSFLFLTGFLVFYAKYRKRLYGIS